VRERRFDPVLMDCQIPGMDGFEAARRTRAEERAEGRVPLRIVALTANALGETASAAWTLAWTITSTSPSARPNGPSCFSATWVAAEGGSNAGRAPGRSQAGPRPLGSRPT
jgi:CheY-like chemotaxis protein